MHFPPFVTHPLISKICTDARIKEGERELAGEELIDAVLMVAQSSQGSRARVSGGMPQGPEGAMTGSFLPVCLILLPGLGDRKVRTLAILSIQNMGPRDYPGGPVAKTPCSQSRGLGFHHQGAKISHVTTKEFSCNN